MFKADIQLDSIKDDTWNKVFFICLISEMKCGSEHSQR